MVVQFRLGGVVNRERSIMLKFIPTTRIAGLVFGSAALIAVIATAPVTPAAAQGVPAGLLRLDSSVAAENSNAQLTDLQQPKVRAAYASTRKHKPVH
jgi:hypothetical protein